MKRSVNMAHARLRHANMGWAHKAPAARRQLVMLNGTPRSQLLTDVGTISRSHLMSRTRPEAVPLAVRLASAIAAALRGDGERPGSAAAMAGTQHML